MSLIQCLQKITKPIFGEFQTEEFKKFLRMGALFSCIIAVNWTFSPLKSALFCTLIGADQIPWAKTISIFFLIPLLLIYSKFLDLYKREKVFYLLSIYFAIMALIFSLVFMYLNPLTALCKASWSINTIDFFPFIIGYAFYFYAESYGALIIALFWAIASDTTTPQSAKKGYSFIIALGQLGGILGPILITSLPRRLGLTTSALSIFMCVGLILLSMYLIKNFFKKTPANLLIAYHGKNELEKESIKKPGFLEGVRLLFRNVYLLGIFAVIAFPEIIITIIELHFNILAAETYKGTALAEYLGMYGTSVNFIALAFLLLGIGTISRVLGIGIALLLMPIIYSGAIVGFVTLNSLHFLFILMVSSKAINYALNGPAIKQLYIPTTHDVRFKSQAWIETFGSKGSKAAGALFNMLLAPLQKQLGPVAGRMRHTTVSGYLGATIIILWICIALFLGKKYKKAITENKMVC